MNETVSELRDRGWGIWDCPDAGIVASHDDFVLCVGIDEDTANQFSGGCWAIRGANGQLTPRNHSESG